eukprot:403376121
MSEQINQKEQQSLDIKVVQTIEEFYELTHRKTYNPKYKAFYSSFTREYTTDPAKMRAFIGDEIVSNGHALFDNGQVRDGYILHLEQHLDRMYKGAKNTRMDSNMPHTREEIREIVQNLVALSGSRNAAIRYFLSGGVNGQETQFYLILEDGIPMKPVDGTIDFTFYNPFEKEDLMKMKTTNNIELCTFKKIIHSHNQDSFGMIIKPVVSQVSDSQVDHYELVTLNDSVLILAMREEQGLGYTFKFEGGIKRIEDDKHLLISQLKLNQHQIEDNQNISVFQDEKMAQLTSETIVGLFRFEGSQIYEIESINGKVLPRDEKAKQILDDAWREVLTQDCLEI